MTTTPRRYAHLGFLNYKTWQNSEQHKRQRPYQNYNHSPNDLAVESHKRR